jgi:iron complex outermembrane receptor protein
MLLIRSAFRRCFLHVPMIVLCLTGTAWAQTAVIGGTVLDPTGTPIAGAAVRVGSANTRTDDTGRFTVAGQRASVTVTIDAPGFATATFPDTPPGSQLKVTLVPAAQSAVTVLATPSRVATKAETELRLLTQAVSILPAQVMADQQIDDLDTAVRNIAGAVVAGNNVYGVRGIVANSDGNFRRNGTETWAIAPLVNQNVERVEILKGPASVLYGRLDPGGLFNVVTKQPQSQSQYRGEVRGGAFGYAEARVDLTGPITSSRSVLYRVNAAVERRNSFRSQVDSDGVFVSPVLSGNIGSRLRWSVEGEYQTDRVTHDPGLAAATTGFGALDARPIDVFLGEPDADVRLRVLTGQATAEFQVRPSWTIRAIGQATSYDRTQETVGLAAVQANGRLINRSALYRDQDYQIRSGELMIAGRFSTGPLTHRLSAGFNTQVTNSEEVQSRGTLGAIDLFSPVYVGFPATPTQSASTTQDVTLHGAYVQHQASLSPAWHVTIGGRLTEFDQRDLNRLTNAPRRFTARELSPHAGVVYAPRPWVALYGSYAEAFKPTLNTDRAGRPFDPQFGKQWEVGTKFDLFDKRLSTTVAWFTMDRTNQLSFILDPATGLFDTKQGGVHRSRGAEVEIQGRIGSAWTMLASYAYLDAVVVTDPAYVPGRRLGAAPEHSGSAWITRRLGERMVLGGGVFFQTEFKAFTSGTVFLPGFTTVDAMASYQLSPRIQVQVNGRNLGNTRYYLTGAGSNIATPGGPRSVQATLRVGLR